MSSFLIKYFLPFQQCDVLKEFIKNSEVFPSLELKTFAESLVANSLPSLMVNPEDSSDRRTVIEMTVHTAAVLLSGQNRILEPLKNLAFLPSTMQVKEIHAEFSSTILLSSKPFPLR